MPYIHGRNTYLSACDIFGASFLISNDMNSITLTRSKDNPTFSTFAASNVQRVVGIADATLTGAFIWNGAEAAASGVPQILDDMMSGSWITPLKWAPGGSTAGCPVYSACMMISALEITANTGGVVAGTFTFQNAASAGIVSGSAAA